MTNTTTKSLVRPKLLATGLLLLALVGCEAKEPSFFDPATTLGVNQPPIADAGGPYTGTEGASVPMDGSSSTDLDGTITRYAWDFGDGTNGTGSAPSHTYAMAGTYDVVLTVTDNDGATDVDSTTATIGGTSFPSIGQLDGLSVSVEYNWISSTCDTPPLVDFTAPADLTASGTTLNIQFGDAPVPISGTYVVETGAFDGDTGPVDIGGGFDADEMWNTNFTLSGSMIMMTGTSFVDVTSGGSPVCNRQFNVSFTASF